MFCLHARYEIGNNLNSNPLFLIDTCMKGCIANSLSARKRKEKKPFQYMRIFQGILFEKMNRKQNRINVSKTESRRVMAALLVVLGWICFFNSMRRSFHSQQKSRRIVLIWTCSWFFPAQSAYHSCFRWIWTAQPTLIGPAMALAPGKHDSP